MAERKNTALRILCLTSTLFVCVLAYLLITPSQAARLQTQLGYFFCILLVGGLLVTLLLAYRPNASQYRRLWQNYHLKKWAVLLVVATSILQHVHQTHFFKVINDEYVLLSISRAMHEEYKAGWRAEVEQVDGVTAVTTHVMDKRPLLYPWILAQVHSLTGYRTENAFILNGLIGVLFLFLLYAWISRYLSEWLGLTAIVLWASNPLWAQNCTGGGFEVLNLFFLLCLLVSTTLWMEKPDERRFAVVVLFAACLANVRYESILFALIPIGILFFLMRRKMHPIPWAGTIAPLALLSLLISQVYFHANPEAFYQSGGEAFLSFQYIPENLASTIYYLYNFSPHYSNDWVLSYAGTLAFFLFLIEARRQVKQPGSGVYNYLTVFFTIVVLLHLFLLLSLRWGSWMDVEVARFSLPLQLYLLLVLLAVAHSFSSQNPIRGKIIFFTTIAVYVFISLPNLSRESSTDRMLPSLDIDRAVQTVNRANPYRDGLVLTNTSTIPFTNRDHLVLRLSEVNYVAEDVINWAQSGRFPRVVVLERLQLDLNTLQWNSELPESLRTILNQEADLFDSYNVSGTRRSHIWVWPIPVTTETSLRPAGWKDKTFEEKWIYFHGVPRQNPPSMDGVSSPDKTRKQ